MKKRVVGISLVLVLLIGAGALTYALADGWGRHEPGRHGSRFGHGIMRMLRGLELSDDQKAQISGTLMAARKTAIVSGAQLSVAHMELHEALLQDEVDEAAVEKLKEQIKALQGELLDSRVQTHQSIHGILTPEQRKQARTLFLEKMDDKLEGRFHHGRRSERFHGDGEGRQHGQGQRH